MQRDTASAFGLLVAVHSLQTCKKGDSESFKCIAPRQTFTPLHIHDTDCILPAIPRSRQELCPPLLTVFFRPAIHDIHLCCRFNVLDAYNCRPIVYFLIFFCGFDHKSCKLNQLSVCDLKNVARRHSPFFCRLAGPIADPCQCVVYPVAWPVVGEDNPVTLRCKPNLNYSAFVVYPLSIQCS